MAAQMISVRDEHFPYLFLQKGELDYLKGDRVAWQAAYERSLEDDFASIKRYLPEQCGSVLDIGGGLGGIDILLARCYPGLQVRILDGEADAPKLILHDQTFNHMEATRSFLEANGVTDFGYYTPAKLLPLRPFDLIISLRSWCFHYSPRTYLEFVRCCCGPNTRLIIDVRNGRADWMQQLPFEMVRLNSLPGSPLNSGRAVVGLKFTRMVFDVPKPRIIASAAKAFSG